MFCCRVGEGKRGRERCRWVGPEAGSLPAAVCPIVLVGVRKAVLGRAACSERGRVFGEIGLKKAGLTPIH